MRGQEARTENHVVAEVVLAPEAVRAPEGNEFSIAIWEEAMGEK